MGADGFASFEPPQPLELAPTLILIEDQDDAGRRAVAAAAARWAQQGYKIRIARPVVGNDINDALLELGPAAGATICTIEDYAEVPTGDWYSRCLAGSDGRTLSNLANAVLGLRSDPAFDGMLGFDAFASVVVVHRQAPKTVNQTKFTDPEPRYPRALSDNDISHIQEWLQLAGLETLSATTTYQAVEAVAREYSFHPVREYLDKLSWDKTARVEKWLTTYLGASENEYTKAVGRMFLIGMVARVREPGCQCDYMPILEGPQGDEKSKALRILGGEWFSDNLPSDVSSKDSKQHLYGKWLIEIPDLHSFKKSDTRELKAFQTRREDQFRPPYGRKEVFRKRQNVFAATTNEEAYLEDPTGGRRYWPLKTGEINVEKLIEDRDQLFAEAVHLFNTGTRWWPDRNFEKTYMMPEQDARYSGDA
jgi:hypothetical protein